VKRTQILLSEEVHDALRAKGFAERTSLGEQVRRAIVIYLGRAQGGRSAKRLHGSNGQPGAGRRKRSTRS
jgi:hypothetical protein